MTLLLMGLVIFIGTHLITTFTGMRASLIARWGEATYKGLYSVAAAIGFGLIIYGYARAPYIPVWDPPVWARHITFLLMLPVFPLLFAAYIPGQIKRFVPHPMLLAIKLWAVAHLITKGTAAAMLLYAAILAWAVYDLISVKRRERAGLVAIRTGPFLNDVMAVGVGLVAYFYMLYWGHWKLFGVPVLPA
jgi:uncharacterized membrane protein